MKSQSNFFFDRENIRTIDTYHIIYLISCILSFVLTEIGRYMYRPYIYENNINDYGIAQLILPKGVFDWKDIYGTIIGGLIGLFLFLSIHKVITKNKIIYRF